MADIGEIKARMNSIAEIKKVTDAMYMISSVKMRKAKKYVSDTEPYFNALVEEISELFKYIPKTENRYFHSVTPNENVHSRRGILLITSDKGLSGTYNYTAVKVAEEYMSRHPETMLFIVGEYGRQYFKNKKIPFCKDFLYSSTIPTVLEAEKICIELLEYFDDNKLDEIDIIYTDYRGGKPSECKRNCLLPLDRSQFNSVGRQTEKSFREFYPDADTVLSEIIPSYLTGFIYGSLVDSYCSEQEARMTAMNTASSNAEEMLKKLKSQYNSIRQAAITNEMIEISSGARALRAKHKKQSEAKKVEH